VLPVDPALVDLAAGHRLTVTVEDNGTAGGFGDAFVRAMRAAGAAADVMSLGLPQEFLAHGRRNAMLSSFGLDGDGIAAAVLDRRRDADIVSAPAAISSVARAASSAV
jgi:1-deoxy-D-xylulose-5-phosphate synthase